MLTFGLSATAEQVADVLKDEILGKTGMLVSFLIGTLSKSWDTY